MWCGGAVCWAMPAQVSELSHKLGSAQGSSKSLEQEVAQLRSQVQQLSSEKHSLEMQLSDTRAKLCAAQEKVRRDAGWCALAASSAVPCTSRSPGVGCRTPCGSTHTVCFPGPGRGAAAGAARRPGGCRVPVGGPLQRPARPGDGARGALQGGSGRGGQGQRHHPAAAGEGRGGGGGQGACDLVGGSALLARHRLPPAPALLLLPLVRTSAGTRHRTTCALSARRASARRPSCCARSRSWAPGRASWRRRSARPPASHTHRCVVAARRTALLVFGAGVILPWRL